MGHFMRARVSGLVFFALLAIAPVSADIVTYDTTGVFTSSGNNVLHGANGLTITYGNTTNNMVTVPPTSAASFGTFTVSGPTSGTDTVSEHFSLTISQSTPTVGSETLTDMFQGDISASSSHVVLTFTGGGPSMPIMTANPITFAPAYSFQLGPVTYWVNKVTQLNPSSTNSGVSSIDGAITAQTTTVADGGMTLILLGGVLIGIEGLRRRLRIS